MKKLARALPIFASGLWMTAPSLQGAELTIKPMAEKQHSISMSASSSRISAGSTSHHNPVIATSVGTTTGPMSLSVSSISATKPLEGEWKRRVGGSIGFEADYGILNTAIGAGGLAYPGTDSAGTAYSYVSLTLDTLLSPNVTTYVDLDNGTEGGLYTAVSLSETIFEQGDFGIGIFANTAYDAPVEGKSARTPLSYGASASYDFIKVTGKFVAPINQETADRLSTPDADNGNMPKRFAMTMSASQSF